VQRYINDPKTDFHQWVADITGLDRKPAKDANFAKIYGAREKKFAMMIGKSIAEATEIMKQYDREMPFGNLLFQMCERVAEESGYIKLLDGARIRFDWWFAGFRSNDNSSKWSNADFSSDCRGDEARRRVADENHPWFNQRLRRSRCYKALNGLIQGSAARQTKMAMRACAQAGIMPVLQIHDELCFSIKDHKSVAEITSIMCNAAPLVVPMQVDAKVGTSWGNLKD
jgi:DNA polymerase I-like protein with 3'-5' exonuclease and polymerase domains